MDIVQALDQLAECDAQVTALRLREEELVAALTPKIPDEIKNQINDIHAEFATQRSGAETNIAELTKLIKAAVLATGKSVKGTRLHAIYAKGRVTWDTSKLEGLMIAVPQLKELKKQGEPSVSFRSI